jgi:hypothetical protein
MERVIFVAAFIVVASSLLAAQGPVNAPPGPPRPAAASTGKPDQYAVTVKGCIDKRRLAVSDAEAERLPFPGLRATEFTLNGSSDVLRLIREHNGHDDEIAGVVSVPPPRRPVIPSVDAKKLEPLSVGVGGRESIRVDEAPRALALKVESLTHVRNACALNR